jgi:hypothetical protein
VKKLLLILSLSSCLFLKSQDSIPDPAQGMVFALLEKIENENRYTSNLDPESLSSLPVGIIKEIGSIRYIVAIDSATFFPDGAYFNAYMALEIPGSSRKIAFAGKNLRFNPSGVIGGPQARLKLVSRHSIPFGPGFNLIIPADGSSYIDWNCAGFQSFSLKGFFEIGRNRLLPDSTATFDKNVKISFQVSGSNVSDIMVTASMTPFYVKGLPNWRFHVSEVVADLSDFRNPQGIVFPQGYAASGNLWRGFYLKSLKVILPPELSRNGRQTEISVAGLILDNAGVTGTLAAGPVFQLGDGSMSGWAFSLDQVSLSFNQNRVSGGGIAGKILLPAFDSTRAVNFAGTITYNDDSKDLDYGILVSAPGVLQAQCLGAKIQLYQTSYLEVRKNGNTFMPKAVLNGNIRFDREEISTQGLNFTNLILLSTPPYIAGGIFALSGSGNPSGVVGFPVSISQIGIGVSNGNPEIFFDVQLNFSNPGDNFIGGSTRVVVKTQIQKTLYQGGGDYPVSYEKIRWKLDRVAVGNILIEVNTAPFYLKTIVSHRNNDPVYGKGFFGNAKFLLKNVIRDTAMATVCFGSTTFRYWYADVFIPVNIPLGPAPASVMLSRINGGLYYRMKPQRIHAGDYIAGLNGNYSPGQPTQTYIPDQNSALGFKIGAAFRYIPSEKAMNGEVMLEASFSSGGSLNSVLLQGNIYAMATVNERASRPAPVRGFGSISFFPQEKIFDASFTALLESAPGITGSGTARIYIAPGTWYVCAGKPTQPLTVSILGLGNASAYFMTGNQLEPMPPPPPALSNLVAQSGLAHLRNTNSLTSGSGFCAGARISSSFYKELGWDFFTIYGGFNFLAGFDLMLANYGPGARCAENNQAAGLNGWQASGQLYLLLQGSIGVKGTLGSSICNADWCRQSFDITVLSGSIAAIVYGKVPRPSYFSGNVACTYSILGLVNGNFNFEFKVGQNCTVQG